jgi:hypothetical protein
MHMLRMFRLSRSKKKKTGHAEFGHNIPELIVLRKPHRHTFAIPLDSLKGCTDKPGKHPTPLTDDVCPSNPAVGELGPEETFAQLIGHNFGFGQFRHGTNPRNDQRIPLSQLSDN